MLPSPRRVSIPENALPLSGRVSPSDISDDGRTCTAFGWTI